LDLACNSRSRGVPNYGGQVTDAELMALGALVQADSVDIETQNRRELAKEESFARVNNETISLDPQRSVADCESYQKLVAELRRREIL
jgi:hypothetical protein